jgi:hypothetical protein
MRTTAIVIALFLVGAAALTVVPETAAQAAAGWTTLFNGRNLDNWNKTGNANWRVADGVIEADMPRGFLLTKESYTDFDLRADIWATPDSNGGVLFHITDPGNPGIENGYELNINDKRADQTGRTGAIVNVARPLVQFDSGNKWTTIEISVRGTHMTAKLDGTLVAEADDAKYKSGPVSLQAAGGLVRYRNVQIRPVK